jgi:class 3 adenylate cyclase
MGVRGVTGVDRNGVISLQRSGNLWGASARRSDVLRSRRFDHSTGISAKLDAEEWRDLVGAYVNAASAAVTDMGGKVAKKLGDGLMALFGHPVAQENR